jgi:regulator of RNase E activity RraA
MEFNPIFIDHRSPNPKDRPDMELTERLEHCYTGAVYDVMRDRGLRECVLPREIRSFDVNQKLAGQIFTLHGRPQARISAHESLLHWTGFLSKAPADQVVICQPEDDVRALMGELSAETLQRRGIRGFIVDGGCRDTNFISKLHFPVFCRFYSPRDIVGAWAPDSFGESITIGDVTIQNGDYVLGDRDGIVVIPRDIATEVVTEVEAVISTENLVRKAISEGVDPQVAYLRHGKF